jgi:AraC-like DNA-binding protein
MQISSCAVSEFHDPNEYAASFLGAETELSVTGRGRFSARVTRLDLGRLRMHQFDESLPRTGHWANSVSRAVVTFRTSPGPPVFFCGAEMTSTNITRHQEYEAGFLSSTGAASWASMSMSPEDMAAAGELIGGCDLSPPKQDLVLAPSLPAMARLQRLHVKAARLATDDPAAIANRAVARGLEQTLTEALVDCLACGEVREDREALRRHRKILRRFRSFVEENQFEAIFVPELCAAIGVAQRTLQAICQEQLGTSPKKYLILRRMFLVRKALLESDPVTSSVTDIATRYGFWELGRFAVEYRSMFSESPSATLKGERRR